MNPKYELTDETMYQDGRTLHRIRALKDFRLVKTGDIGGWIESEENLSHKGDCWVFDNGMVFNNGMVFGNGRVYNNGRVFDNGMVFGNGRVYDNGRVFDYGQVYGNGAVFDDGAVFDNGEVFGDGCVFGNGKVVGKDDILIFGSIGSRGGNATFFRCSDNSIKVNCGCFYGTISEFAEAVKETHGDNKFAREYALAIELAKVHMGEEVLKEENERRKRRK